MSYKDQVEGAIVAAGHAVEWKPWRQARADEPAPPAPTLHIDGVDTCERDLRAGAYVTGVDGWRARPLHADPAKAAAQLVDRHGAQIHNAERCSRENARIEAEERHRLALEAHLRAFCRVRVRGAVTLDFDRLTVEQAEKIAAALR